MVDEGEAVRLDVERALERPAVESPPSQPPRRPKQRLVLERPEPAAEPAAIAVPSAPAASLASQAAPAAEKKTEEKMSTEEYVAREMHYIGKIQQDAAAVLARAAADREKNARLEAELDALESP